MAGPFTLLLWFILNLPLVLLLSLPLAAGGAIGYLIGGVEGAFGGVIAAFVLLVAFFAWREERKGRDKPQAEDVPRPTLLSKKRRL